MCLGKQLACIPPVLRLPVFSIAILLSFLKPSDAYNKLAYVHKTTRTIYLNIIICEENIPFKYIKI